MTTKWAYAWGEPHQTAQFRSHLHDFCVDEVLGFEPTGEGEHLYLHVRKRSENTAWVAKRLAEHFDCHQRDVSYSGLKDRHGVTSQWFSVWLPGRDVTDEIATLSLTNVECLAQHRNRRKLKRGVHKGNQFRIVLRGIEDSASVDQRLANIQQEGFPNYFGEQRFGIDGQNMAKAMALFEGKLKRVKREQRGFYLSAARSWLFNAILSQRVAENTWRTAQQGELMMLAGTQRTFLPDATDTTYQQRCCEQDIHPTAALWGRGEAGCGPEFAAHEADIVAPHSMLAHGLEGYGLKQERRATRAIAQDLRWEWHGDDLTLSFFLDRSAYATALLREVVVLTAAER